MSLFHNMLSCHPKHLLFDNKLINNGQVLTLHKMCRLFSLRHGNLSFLKSAYAVCRCLHNVKELMSAGKLKLNLIIPVLRKLHWLPVQFRSEFKLATLVYKFIHTGFPKYFDIYPHTTILTILDVVRVLPTS